MNIETISHFRMIRDLALLAGQLSLVEWVLLGSSGVFLGLLSARLLWHQKAVSIKKPRIFGVGDPDEKRSWLWGLFSRRFFGREQHIAYLMDVSISLGEAEFNRCKKDLSTAIRELAKSARYQVIFFSGAAWFAHQRMIQGGDQGQHVVIADGHKRMIWRYRFGGHRYEKGNENPPPGQWRKATRANKKATIADIEEVNQSHGTSWHIPFMMALALDPAPSHIYFLTDGETSQQDVVARGILEMVDRRGSRTKIDTRGLRLKTPAVEALTSISDRTQGKYAKV